MRLTSALLALLFLATPSLALAFPFGGQASTVVPCYNQAIFARLGAPRGGDYIWTPATKTYLFGPPSHVGQWLLGLASAPYYCVVSIQPVIVWAGIAIDMMGSSGGPGNSIANLLAKGGSSGSLSAAPPSTPTYTPPTVVGSGGSANPTTIGHVVVSEIYANVDSKHGTQVNQWVELFNGNSQTADISGWTVQDQNTTYKITLPQGTTLLPGQFLVLIADAKTSSLYWSIPPSARIITVGDPVGKLNSSSGSLSIKNGTTTVDVVSWGTNTLAFNPSASAMTYGASLARQALSFDSNTSTDWVLKSPPTPGQ